MRLLLAALLFAGTTAQGEVTFKNAHFAVELGTDWEQVPVPFVEHVAFRSKSRNLVLKMDSSPAPLKRRTAQEAARAFLDAAVKRAQEEEGITITDRSTSAWRRTGAMATFSGRSKEQRILRVVGVIEGNKFVYLELETNAKGEKALESALHAVLDRLRVIQ